MRDARPGECVNSTDMQIIPGKVEQLTTCSCGRQHTFAPLSDVTDIAPAPQWTEEQVRAIRAFAEALIAEGNEGSTDEWFRTFVRKRAARFLSEPPR